MEKVQSRNPFAFDDKGASRWNIDEKGSYDYVSPNMKVPHLGYKFPHMIEGEKNNVTWPYFFKNHNHKWYVDERNPIVGFINVDEAAILLSNARKYSGKRTLEIGAYRGWSSAYILNANPQSHDIIDPAFSDPDWKREVYEDITSAAPNFSGSVNLHEGRSPDLVHAIGSIGTKWSFIFIDGDHEGDAPAVDAIACSKYVENDCMIMFHDLMSPHVSNGLFALKEMGWQTGYYCTAQVMGAAWTGAICPISHNPDSALDRDLPDYVNRFDRISNK